MYSKLLLIQEIHIVKLMLGIKKIKSASHFDNILKHMQYSKYGPKG